MPDEKVTAFRKEKYGSSGLTPPNLKQRATQTPSANQQTSLRLSSESSREVDRNWVLNWPFSVRSGSAEAGVVSLK
jgi:hypothetical protein